MKVYIKSDDGRPFKLWLPTRLIKSKLLWNAMLKKGGVSLLPLRDNLPTMYKELRKYIKKFGHFILVDIVSAEGDIVIIKV